MSPETRQQKAKYLADRAEVIIVRQNEVPEEPPFAIAVVGTEFWIDCCETEGLATARAIELGLKVKEGM